MIVSLREGAKLAGVSRQTIYRRAQSGELSTTKRHDGSKGVDVSELQRVFGTLRTDETDSGDSQSDTARQPTEQADTAAQAVLEVKLAAAEQRISDLEADRERLEADKSRLWDQVESQRLLLEHQTEAKPDPQPGPQGDGLRHGLLLVAVSIIVAAGLVLGAL